MKKILLICCIIIWTITIIAVLDYKRCYEYRMQLQFTKLTPISNDNGRGNSTVLHYEIGDNFGSFEIIY